MSATHSPTLVRYREAVAELMETGESFGDVVAAIDAASDLTVAEKTSLRLFAYSLRGG
jgi:hypothetical protein